MRDINILFSTPMVLAQLADLKTMTRRVVNPQPRRDEVTKTLMWPTGRKSGMTEFGVDGLDIPPGVLARCPYGQPGDTLVTRETFFAWGHWTKRLNKKKGREEWHFVDETLGSGNAYRYEATEKMPRRKRELHEVGWWKRPAIFMPKAAVRIRRKITAVRVERLWTIWDNEADCMAEGIEEMPPHPCGTRLWRNYLPGHPQSWSPNLATPGNSFATLWRSINGDASWDANPYVWVISFEGAK